MYSDIFIYLDLTKNYLKMKDIVKSIKNYIEEKNKVNIKGHYGVLIFQDEGNPIFITDKKDSVIISKAIEINWKNRAKETSYFENGLFYIFSYIAETVRKKSKFNRIIIITDTPSDLSSEYQEALFNLVSKIKHFPTFIDIIRIIDVNTGLQKDDVKLNVLASDTKGGIFYVKDKKELQATLIKLVKTKQLVDTFEDRPDELKIRSEDYDFYSNLAKPLQKSSEENIVCHLCHDEVCPVCTNVQDIPLICEDCKVGIHTCCIINYTLTHNIGIPHIFRCPSCDVLVKIDQNLIVSVEDSIDTSVEDYIDKEVHIKEFKETEVVEANDHNLKESAQPKIIEELSEQEKEIPIIINDQYTSEKIVRVGGFFGKMYNVKKVGGKLVYNRIEAENPRERPKISTICTNCKKEIIDDLNYCEECGKKLTL